MAKSIRASLNRVKTEVITPDNEDRAVGVPDVASLTTDMADYAATASNVVATFGGQVSNVVGGLGSLGTTAMGAIGSAAAAVELGLAIRERRAAKRDIKAYREKVADPEVMHLLQQRTHATAVLDTGRAEMAKVQLERAGLEQQLARLEATNSADVEGRREIEAQITAKDVQAGKIEAALQKADERINEINATPQMKELHVIESKAALANAMLKRSGDFRMDAAETALKGASTLLDVGQGTFGVAAGAASTATSVVNAVPLVGGAVSIVTGTGQGLVSGASLIHNAYRSHKEGVRERKARDAREGIDDPELNAAVKRVQNKAGRNKIERRVMALRDSAGVVAGASAAVAGAAIVATGILGAASAPGFGAGALPPLIVAGGSAALAVGAGAVSAAAAGGAQLFKVGRHLQSVWHKNDAIRCAEVAGELQRLGLMKLPSDEKGNPLPLPKGYLSPTKAAALERVQKLAIKKGYLTPEEALDPAKLGEFAKVRLITRDTRFAVDTLSKKLLAECDVAIQHRGGNGIVTSDLPNTPAVNAARKLGIKDNEIVGMVNAAHDERTRLVAKQTIAQKTGLRSGTDAEVKRAPFVVKRK